MGVECGCCVYYLVLIGCFVVSCMRSCYAMKQSPDVVKISLLYRSLQQLGVLCHLRIAALSINSICGAGNRRQNDHCRHCSSTRTGQSPTTPTRMVYHVVKVWSPPPILSSHRKGGVSEASEEV